jgi:hypothetical protein
MHDILILTVELVGIKSQHKARYLNSHISGVGGNAKKSQLHDILFFAPWSW